MTRGQLNRMLVIPALILGVGIAIALIYPFSRDGAGICTESETAQAPSGRDLRHCQTLYETQPSGAVWAVIRVVDGEGPGGVADHVDHDWACARWGLPALDAEPRPQRIVVQIMQAPFVRGEPSQGISQSIEAYSIANAACQWELL